MRGRTSSGGVRPAHAWVGMEELGDLSRVQGRRHWRGEGGEVLLHYGLPHHQHIGRVPRLYMGQLGVQG